MTGILLSFGVLVIEVFILSGIALLLHYFSSRYGISLLLMYIATIIGILTYAGSLNIYLEPISGIILTIPGDIFIPTILATILILYVVDGTEITQAVIFGISIIQLLVAIVFVIISLTAYLPVTAAISEIPFTDILKVNLQSMIAGVIAFIIDMFVVAVVYQGIHNFFRRQKVWIAAVGALLCGLWTDALTFNFLASIGQGDFTLFIAGDLLSKTLTALTISPIIVLYLVQFAPRRLHKKNLHHYRPTFDILNNLFGDWRLKIIKLEMELRESEINTNQLIKHIQEIFWIADYNDNQSYFLSPAFETVLGISRGDYYLNPNIIHDIIHEDDIERVMGQWLTYVDHNREIEFRIVRANGDLQWIRDRTYLIKDTELNINRVIGISEDITSQKKLQELQNAIEIEHEKIKFLNDLVREVSHDLQSPINAIGLKVDLLRRVKGDVVREERYLSELKKQTKHLSELVEYVFVLIKNKSRVDIIEEICSFNNICQDVFDILYPNAEAKKVSISIELAQTMPHILCNKNDLHRAVMNLVSNAIRYTPADGTVSIQTKHDDKHITLMVSDTGIGIREDEIPLIFERFYRASNASTIDGTGLGLAISKQIIEQNGGTIKIKSVLNEGTTFIVNLPLVKIK